jgi:hypothetical protein
MTSTEAPKPVSYIVSPRHPALRELETYWLAKKGSRQMPARAEIKPSEIKHLLPDIVMWSAPEPFIYRIIGDNVVRFVGKNNTGSPATTGMPPDAAASMLEVLALIVSAKEPRFRAGKAHWQPDKSQHEFEAAYFPLSADGQTVDMILGGIKFDFDKR